MVDVNCVEEQGGVRDLFASETRLNTTSADESRLDLVTVLVLRGADCGNDSVALRVDASCGGGGGKRRPSVASLGANRLIVAEDCRKGFAER